MHCEINIDWLKKEDERWSRQFVWERNYPFGLIVHLLVILLHVQRKNGFCHLQVTKSFKKEVFPFSNLGRVKRELWPRNQLFESRYYFRIALNLFALNNSTADRSKQIRTNSCCFIQILICILNFLRSNLYRDFFYPEFFFFFFCSFLNLSRSGFEHYFQTTDLFTFMCFLVVSKDLRN
jgi:hypothetical protein